MKNSIYMHILLCIYLIRHTVVLKAFKKKNGFNICDIYLVVYYCIQRWHIFLWRTEASNHSFIPQSKCHVICVNILGYEHNSLKTLLWLKCRTAILKVLFLYFNLCWSVKLDSLSCPFASISFLSKYIYIYIMHKLHRWCNG